MTYVTVGLVWCQDDLSNICVTLRERIKEATNTLRKQDPAFPENHALNTWEECIQQVWSVL